MLKAKSIVVAVVFGFAVLGTAGGAVTQELTLDGEPFSGPVTAAGPTQPLDGGGQKAPVVDVVGGTASSATNPGRAKGNAYRVDLSTGLVEAEFWLTFSDSQTLAFYVYQSPVEFGTYTQVFTTSATVTGTGAGWYSSGPINYRLEAGNYYIIAVSWSGGMTYYYNSADSQVVSFGEHVHGYAVGLHPLPGTFSSTSNDQAIYHQRLTTDVDVPVELQALSVD